MLSIVITGCLLVPAAADDKETRVYEMRTYHAAPGKLDDLHKRFRDHTCKLFEKHGIANVGYWVPVDNKDNKLIFVLSYPSREAREKAWKAFLADPDWQKAYRDSEAAGKLVQKVENVFLTRTDYSPQPKKEKTGDRVFELRTYTASDGNLAALNSRFRDHTLKLFEKHGMTNVVYWDLMRDQKEADVKLIYLLAHKSLDAAKASFDAFRKDPDWVKARTESETRAGGSLTAKEGVKSEFLKATDYSPIQ
jgi:hypothetical protein